MLPGVCGTFLLSLVAFGLGVVAFGVAVYWVTRVERKAGEACPGLMEIWHRFPKFMLGFVAASVAFSWLAASSADGERVVDAVLGHTGTTSICA